MAIAIHLTVEAAWLVVGLYFDYSFCPPKHAADSAPYIISSVLGWTNLQRWLIPSQKGTVTQYGVTGCDIAICWHLSGDSANPQQAQKLKDTLG